MLLRLLLSMAAVGSSAADECFAPAGQLAGRLVVITGASRGVGAELARTFASEGAMVVVNYYKSKDKAEAVRTKSSDTSPERRPSARRLPSKTSRRRASSSQRRHPTPSRAKVCRWTAG